MDLCRVVRTGVSRWTAAAVALLAVGSASHAQVDNWGTNGGPGSPTYASETQPFATLGTNVLRTVNPQGSFWGPSTGNLITDGFYTALRDAARISFDLTLNNNDLNGGQPFAGFAQANELSVSLFANPGGTFPSTLNVFSQRNFATGNGTDTSGTNATWSGVNGTRTITYDLTQFTGTDTDGATKTIGQILAAHPDIPLARINFVQQLGGGTNPGSFFWDNVRLLDTGGNTLAIIGNFEPIPEPGSMALAALAVPPLVVAYRRRRAARTAEATADAAV